MDTTTSFIAIILLLGTNAFFVAAEFALVKTRAFRIETAANAGSAAAGLTLRIQGNLEAYLAACQLGITMASLGLGWVGEPAVASLLEPMFESLGMPQEMLHTTAFIVGFLIFSSLHIVVGEQVPKTFAIRKAEPVSIWVAYPLHFSYLLVWPLNFLLNKASRGILALFGVEEATHGDVFSGEEIKGMVATSKQHGEIHHQQAEMLHNLFEFDRRQVGRVMIPQTSIHALDVSATPEANLTIIRDTEHSRFPVIDSSDDDSIVGVLLAKDIHRALLNGETDPWRDIRALCREPLVVPETQHVPELFEQMRGARAHMAFVIDEYGAFVGIVTLEDLLEEIVGEIHDETDEEADQVDIVALPDGSWEAGGLVSLSDIERMVGMSVPVELDANTPSGLLMTRLGRVPEPGDRIRESGFELQVLTVEEHRAGRVKLTPLDQPIESPTGGDATPDVDSGDMQ